MIAVLPAIARQLLVDHLPDDLEIRWVQTREEAVAAIVDADIAWVDLPPHGLTTEAVAAGRTLRWLFTAIAGLEALDLEALAKQGTIVTNGAGILAAPVAEYAVMGVLVAAKRFDDVVRAQDRHEWLQGAPGTIELTDSRALVIGYGSIGRMIGDRLKAFGVQVTGVTRSGSDDTLTPDQWQATLGEFDWVILAAPSTGATKALIGASELAAMKPTAWLINIARGDMIDDDALIAALKAKTIAGAFLDPTSPEPLPADHALWDAPNMMITAHLSGRSTTKMFRRAAVLFLDNLSAWRDGKPMKNVVDLGKGY